MECKHCGSCQLNIIFKEYDPITYEVKCGECKVSYVIHGLEELENKPQINNLKCIVRKPIKKFLLLEDGSVDINDLNNIGDDIKVIVYRQGSQPPKFIDLGEKE